MKKLGGQISGCTSIKLMPFVGRVALGNDQYISENTITRGSWWPVGLGWVLPPYFHSSTGHCGHCSLRKLGDGSLSPPPEAALVCFLQGWVNLRLFSVATGTVQKLFILGCLQFLPLAKGKDSKFNSQHYIII